VRVNQGNTVKKFVIEITSAKDGKVRIEGLEYFSAKGCVSTFDKAVSPKELQEKVDLCLRSLDTDELR
jgi:hypothetical protein